MRSVVIIAGVALAIVYIGLFSFSRAGYGYTGYGGHYAGPSFWYFGGPRFFGSPSVRSGSLGGPGSRGQGLHYGK